MEEGWREREDEEFRLLCLPLAGGACFLICEVGLLWAAAA